MSRVRILLEDRLTVSSADSSKFERVSRLAGRSAAFDAEVTVDVNTQVFPVQEGDVLTFAFVDHGKAAPTSTGPSPEMQPLIDDYEYVCYGKVFNEEDKTAGRRAVYMSFGGLLCQLIADKAIVSEFALDKRVFLLLRKST